MPTGTWTMAGNAAAPLEPPSGLTFPAGQSYEPVSAGLLQGGI